MLAGDESDPLYLSALDTIRDLYDWSSLVADTFEVRGGRVQQKRDGSIEVDQTEFAGANQSIPIKAHRRRHQHEVLCRHEHHQSHQETMPNRMVGAADHDSSLDSSLIGRCK